MSSVRVTVGIICLVLALVARGIWVESAVEPPESYIGSETDTTAVSAEWTATVSPDSSSESSRVDRYGNPIETAVGDYRIDGRGEVYERHSPDTAIPRLAVPAA